MVVANNEINDDKQYTSNAGNFDYHADVAVRCNAHHPMEHISGFTRSHCMLPSGESLCHITLAAAMVNEFVAKHKTQLLASDYHTFLLKIE